MVGKGSLIETGIAAIGTVLWALRWRGQGYPIPYYVHGLAIIGFAVGAGIAALDSGVGALDRTEAVLLPALLSLAVYRVLRGRSSHEFVEARYSDLLPDETYLAARDGAVSSQRIQFLLESRLRPLSNAHQDRVLYFDPNDGRLWVAAGLGSDRTMVRLLLTSRVDAETEFGLISDRSLSR